MNSKNLKDGSIFFIRNFILSPIRINSKMFGKSFLGKSINLSGVLWLEADQNWKKRKLKNWIGTDLKNTASMSLSPKGLTRSRFALEAF